MDVAHIRRVAIAIGCTLVFMMVSGIGLSWWDKRRGQAEEAVVPVPVTAEALHAAYAANEARGQRDYGDRWLAVSGVVDAIELDMTNDPEVALRAGDAGEQVRASMSEADAAAAANLNAGDMVTLTCRDAGEVIGNVFVHECRVTHVVPPANPAG